ncbi:MAG: hypothetical protein B2I17_00130 [Thermoplasmatales archaeon B_DKE]|nr:MAG: hypothetical protein B2I17_00130 [Thermoplasmatales archaeon B_DKE]
MLGKAIEAAIKVMVKIRKKIENYKSYLERNAPVSKVREVLVQTAELMVRNRKLTVENVPVESGTIRYIVNVKSIHKNRTQFFDAYKLSNGLFLEAYGSQVAFENNAGARVKQFGFVEKNIEILWGKV